MEQSENIRPKYAIRLRDLRVSHRITACCFWCGHTYEFAADFLARERPPLSFLAELEPKLRCTLCGNRGAARWTCG